MKRFLVALFAVFLWPMTAFAQDAETPAAPLPRVVLETSAGRIVIEVEDQRAPVTAANFLKYVDEERLDGVTFYRAMQTGPGQGIIQGGVNYDPERVLPPIAHEPTTQTGLTHASGTVSMARHAPGSATGDFFILVGAIPSYDAGRPNSVDADGFAAFGRVIEGMDVARAILAAPTSPTEGEGFLRGQMLEPKITITSARRAEP